MNYEDKVKLLVDYFKSGEKPVEDFNIGMEIEHFIVDSETLKSISYYGDGGVCETLMDLDDGTMEKVIIDDSIMGYDDERFSISIEPGAQFEISINKKKDICCLEKGYNQALEKILPILKAKNQDLVAIGYRPETLIQDVDIIPKKRYCMMYEYFDTEGSLGHNMMLQSASTQVIIDYKDEEDFKRKYRVGYAITPILYSIFDSVLFFEKEELKTFNIRQEIWEKTSPERTGMFKGSMKKEFGYEEYAKAILDISPLFNKEGKYIPDITLEQLLDVEEDVDWAVTHATSIVFPDIRLKKYLEFRMMDSLPSPYSFAVASLIKGVFYSDELEELNKTFEQMTDEIVKGGLKAARANGVQAYYFSDYIINWALKLVDIAEKSLDGCEKKYLDPLKEMLQDLQTPRGCFEKIYKKEGVLEAYKHFKVKL